VPQWILEVLLCSIAAFLFFELIVGWPFMEKKMILGFTFEKSKQHFFTAMSSKDAKAILKHSPYEYENERVFVDQLKDRERICNTKLTTENNELVGKILKTLQKKKP